MSDDAAFKQYVHETGEKANALLSSPHCGDEVHDTLKSFKQIIQSYENMAQDSIGISSDVRFVKKKLEAAIKEKRELEKTIDGLKKFIGDASLNELKLIALTTNTIIKRFSESPPEKDSLTLADVTTIKTNVTGLIKKSIIQIN